jgi:uncharacterized membrane protein
MNSPMLRPTRVIALAGALTLASITGTAGFLLGRYELLPPGIPVHWRHGRPDMFMTKTVGAVFMPLWTQLILVVVIGSVAVLLLYRAQGSAVSRAGTGATREEQAMEEDRDRMLHAAEALSLLGLIWIAFQAHTAWALTELWLNFGGGMGWTYNVTLITSVVLSIVVGTRAAMKIGRPTTHHVDDHTVWRLKALYFNPADPALFVPARVGYGLTLNFGRPIAIAIMLGILIVGLGGPFLLARLVLRQ